MKLIIIFAIIVLTSSSPIDGETTTISLNDAYTQAFSGVINDKSVAILIEDTDHECFKDKLNLPVNGEKIAPEFTASFLIAMASTLCSESFKITRIKEFDAAHEKDSRPYNINCFKKKLQEIDQDAKIIQDFDMTSFDNYNDECEEFNEYMKEIEEKFSKKPDFLTLFNISDDINLDTNSLIIVELTTLIIVKTEPIDEEALQAERDKLIQLTLNQSENILNAILNKI